MQLAYGAACPLMSIAPVATSLGFVAKASAAPRVLRSDCGISLRASRLQPQRSFAESIAGRSTPARRQSSGTLLGVLANRYRRWVPDKFRLARSAVLFYHAPA
ncbi:MAG: hypothetical protein ACK53V_21000 [Planctomycetota bacterium]